MPRLPLHQRVARSITKRLNRLHGLKIGVADTPLQFYVDLLDRRTPFSFSRFGDGEWSAMLDKPGENCDGHEYFPELGADLREAARNPGGYLYGMQILAINSMGREIRSFLRDCRSTITWHDADVFHKANNAGTLFPLVDQLRRMKVVVVGPYHLRTISDNLFPYIDFIEIPLKNCYLEKARIIEECRRSYQKRGPSLFAFSASMTTNVVIHTLFPTMGRDCWLMDFGSLWDVYVGVKSRGGYAAEDWSVRIQKNLGLK